MLSIRTFRRNVEGHLECGPDVRKFEIYFGTLRYIVSTFRDWS
jgi:hypothetical protein